MGKILVIGESCKDIFVYCNANRLCPDIPVPVLSIIKQTENEGMAKNVQRNVLKLQFSPNFDVCDIITNKNWESITKTRYMHNDTNHMFIRIDSDHSKIGKIDLSSISFDYDLIAISDYDKGFLSTSDIEYICDNHNNVFIDTKKIIGEWANKAKFIKINDFEYNNSKKYMTKELLEKTIHTKGAEGCYFNNTNYPTKKVSVKDSSGAGDTFFAALITEYSYSYNIEESIKYANEMASTVVRKKGVATP